MKHQLRSKIYSKLLGIFKTTKSDVIPSCTMKTIRHHYIIQSANLHNSVKT